MDISSFGSDFKLIDESRELFPVKLVVAQNIQHGNFKFLIKYPLKPAILDMDITGQHNNIGADNWRHEIAELNM
jgi:hypothetical protein